MSTPATPSGGDGAFLAGLAAELLRVLEPLQAALEDPLGAQDLLKRYGWEADVPALNLPELRRLFGIGPDFEAVVARIGLLPTADISELPDLVSESLPQVQAVVAHVRGLVELGGQALGFPFDQEAFWRAFPPELADGLLVDYLERRRPLIFAPMLGLGLIAEEAVDPAVSRRLPYVRRRIAWERFERLGRPDDLAREVYGWGTEELAGDLIVDRVARFAVALGLSAGPRDARPWLLERHYPGAHEAVAEAYVPIAVLEDANAGDLGLVVLPIPARVDQLPGLVVAPSASGRASLELGDVTLELSAAGGPDIQLELRPGSARMAGPAGVVAGEILARLRHEPERPGVLIGAAGSHRLEMSAGELGVRLKSDGRGATAGLHFALEQGALVVESGAGDGFLQRVLGDQPIVVPLSAGVSWDAAGGLRFEGGAGLRVLIPIQRQLGFLSLESVSLGLGVAGDGLTLALGATGTAALGPAAVTVEDVGIELAVQPAQEGVQISFGFKPPSGAAIVVDAGPVTGGGYLSFDPAAERYAGALELSFSGISLKAIGLISTQRPIGFSMLIIISAEFSPIQLGYGFTLNGVGGLIGINRTVEVEPLRAGLREGALGAILFPPDPVKRAPEIIAKLSTFFPPAAGRFVVGPMAKIGWGSPTLVTIDIGIVLELPAPVRILVLGRIRAVLPDEKRAVVRLQIDLLGVIDFERREASVDASLIDSVIGPFAISGDMALRLGWGPEPIFMLSVGGYHPRFRAPASFPALRRVAVALATSDNPRLRLEAYFAITSNTVQAGARLDLHVEALGFTLDGTLGFDALVQFDPFRFEVDIAGSLVVRRGSAVLFAIMLQLRLAGPAPWHAVGSASFKVLLLTVKIGFEVRFGDETPPSLEPVQDAPAQLHRALSHAESWSAALPPATDSLVSLRARAIEDAAVVHPLGRLAVRQRLLPLDERITRLGAAPLLAPTTFAVGSAELNGEPTAVTRIREPFAAAQFTELSDEAKLSRPSFEPMVAGVDLAPAAAERGTPVMVPAERLRHKQRTITAAGSIPVETGALTPPGVLDAPRPTAPPISGDGAVVEGVELLEPTLVLTSVEDLRVMGGGQPVSRAAFTTRELDGRRLQLVERHLVREPA